MYGPAGHRRRHAGAEFSPGDAAPLAHGHKLADHDWESGPHPASPVRDPALGLRLASRSCGLPARAGAFYWPPCATARPPSSAAMRTLATATTRAVCASERPPRGQQRSRCGKSCDQRPDLSLELAPSRCRSQTHPSRKPLPFASCRPSKAGQLARPERGLGSSAAAAGAAAAAAAPALDPHDAGGAGTLPASTPHRSISVLNRFRALILDQSYRPVGVANWQRAVCLDLAEKARAGGGVGGEAVRPACGAAVGAASAALPLRPWLAPLLPPRLQAGGRTGLLRRHCAGHQRRVFPARGCAVGRGWGLGSARGMQGMPSGGSWEACAAGRRLAGARSLARWRCWWCHQAGGSDPSAEPAQHHIRPWPAPPPPSALQSCGCAAGAGTPPS